MPPVPIPMNNAQTCTLAQNLGNQTIAASQKKAGPQPP
jgi:hypothetical protein